MLVDEADIGNNENPKSQLVDYWTITKICLAPHSQLNTGLVVSDCEPVSRDRDICPCALMQVTTQTINYQDITHTTGT